MNKDRMIEDFLDEEESYEIVLKFEGNLTLHRRGTNKRKILEEVIEHIEGAIVDNPFDGVSTIAIGSVVGIEEMNLV